VVAVGFVTFASLRERESARVAAKVDPAARRAVASLRRGTRQIVFQHVRRDRDYARIAVAAAAAPRRRTIAGRVCDRVYFAAGRGLCLLRAAGLSPRYTALVLGPNLEVRARVGLPGIVSRARISPDGRWGAATGFVTGHSYRDRGFSTATYLLDLAAGKVVSDLEAFTVTHAGRTIDAVDFNFWGVTFARGGERFYATLGTGGKTYLVEGSVRARRVRVLHEGVECPSLSPDGTRVAYKRRAGDRWRLSVLDLATGRETPLAETRSVDDQAEWLDDGHVLYGLGGHVWRVRADGRGRPSRLLADALSPAVVAGAA
jgi:dipeptidyl aminopeptidase/acylaminoacyl peptidase